MEQEGGRWGKECWERAVGVRLGDLTERGEPKLKERKEGKVLGPGGAVRSQTLSGELRGVSQNREARGAESIWPPKPS